MKSSWRLSTIGRECTVVNGGTPKTGVADYWDGEFEWITPAEMGKRERPYVDCTRRKITAAGIRDSSATPLPPHSVILSSRAPIGHVVINTVPMSTNQGCKGLIPGLGLSTKFLYYFLLAHTSLLNDLGSGTTFKELSSAKLKEVGLPKPPLEEQERIVAILDRTMREISSLKQSAARCTEASSAVLKAKLAEFFPPVPQGGMLTIADIVRAGLLAKPSDGNHGEIHPLRSDYVASGVPFLMACDIREGTVDSLSCKFISEAQANCLRTGFAKDGDVILSHKGTIGRVALLKSRLTTFVLTPQLTFYRTLNNEQLDRDFLFWQLNGPEFQRQLNKAAEAGSTRSYIGITRQLDLRLWIPRIGIQRSIAKHCAEVAAQTRALSGVYEEKLFALGELKQSLLHAAFSGNL